MMFTVEERTDLCNRLIAEAWSDPQVIGAELVGSTAKGLEDRWSDVDLALQVAAGADRGGDRDVNCLCLAIFGFVTYGQRGRGASGKGSSYQSNAGDDRRVSGGELGPGGC